MVVRGILAVVVAIGVAIGLGSVAHAHMTYDDAGIPVQHIEMRWGNYVDRQGDPAIGWHSHDPVTGNARSTPRAGAPDERCIADVAELLGPMAQWVYALGGRARSIGHRMQELIEGAGGRG